MVRPHLEYANVVWVPYYIGDCEMMERVQRRATRFAQELSSLDYDEHRITLQLPTLSYRRLCADMLMVYNILHQNIAFNKNVFSSEFVKRYKG